MSILYNNASIVRSGLVLHLDAANVKSYPGTGTTWYDISGKGQNGTLTNGPVYNSSNIAFDGVNDYVNCGANFDNLFSLGISFNCWIKISSYSAYQRIASFNQSDEYNYDCFVQTNATTGVIQAGVGGGNYRNGATTVALNTWVNVASSSEYASINVYLNGVVDNSTATGTPTYIADKGNFNLGRLISGGTYYYGTFTLGSVSVYNRALSATEIAQNFAALRGRYGI